MTVTHRPRQHREILTQEIPSGLLTLRLPPDMSLDKWVEMETARLKQEYPEITKETIELGPERREEYVTARYLLREAEQRYELCKLQLRESMGAAKKATANNIPYAFRYITDVDGFYTQPYTRDVVQPL
jgi:hypothetical protein